MADTNTNQTEDRAFRVLENAPIDTETKADCWDAFYEASNAKDLANRLEHFDIPDSVKASLLSARKSIEPSQRDRVIEAIQQLGKIDPKVLETAEKHPNILKYLLEAAKRESAEQD